MVLVVPAEAEAVPVSEEAAAAMSCLDSERVLASSRVAREAAVPPEEAADSLRVAEAKVNACKG